MLSTHERNAERQNAPDSAVEARSALRPERGELKRKTVVCIMAAILVIQTVLCAAFALNKAGLFQDEAYTYFLANGSWLHSVPEEGFVYEDGEPWKSWTTVDSFLGIDPDKLYTNQAEDNHPPLYYTLFSLAYSIVPGSTSPVIGCTLNTVFMLACTLLIYALAREVRCSKELSLALSFLWAISPSMVNCMLYLRMYGLLTVFFLAASIAVSRFLRTDKAGWKLALGLFCATTLGFLTQYFFVLYAFPLYLCAGIALLAKRRVKDAALFAAGGIGGIAFAMLLFPPSITHLFSSFRGKQALDKAASGDSFGAFFFEDWRLLNNAVFGGLLAIVIAAIIALAVVALLRRRTESTPKAGMKEASLEWLPVVLMGASAVVFVTLVARVAPFASIRYLMASQPILLTTAFIALFCLAKAATRLPEKRILAAVLAFGVVMTAFGYSHGIKYFDQENEDITALAQENDAMVALWADPILQESLLLDGLSYDKSVYFDDTESFSDFDFSSLANDFTLYVQPGMDFAPYENALEQYSDVSIEYVGETIDHYAAYDVHVGQKS